jgi:hypothetical protein
MGLLFHRTTNIEHGRTEPGAIESADPASFSGRNYLPERESAYALAMRAAAAISSAWEKSASGPIK